MPSRAALTKSSLAALYQHIGDSFSHRILSSAVFAYYFLVLFIVFDRSFANRTSKNLEEFIVNHIAPPYARAF